MRTDLVHWMIDGAISNNLHWQTVFHATQLLDRFLSVRVMPRSRLKICGAAALFVACKFEERYDLDSEVLVRLAKKDFTEDELIRMERVLLRDLQF